MWIKQEFFIILVLLFSFAKCNVKFHSKSHNLTIATNIHESGDAKFDGKVLIVIEVLEDADVISFQQENLKYEGSTVYDGITDLPHNVDAKENVWEVKLIDKNFTQGSNFQFEFTYNGTIPHEFIGNYDENFFIAMSFKSTPIQFVCPMIETNTRSDFLISIKHHKSTTAISNSESTVKEVEETDFLITEFSKLENFLPTSIAIFISNFKSITNEKAEIFGFPKYIDDGIFNKSLDLSTKVIEEFSNYFPSYQLHKLSLIAVPGIIDISSSHGIIFFNQFSLFDQQTPDKIIHHVAHGVAQQFFGNIIAMTPPSDSFITEGLAQFYAYLVASRLSEHENRIMELFGVDIMQSAFEIDANSFTETLMTSKRMPADELNSFARLKGASLMRMMAMVIGEETFGKGVENLFSNFDDATLEDFYGEMQKAVNDDEKTLNLTESFEIWMNKVGYPVLDVEVYEIDKIKIAQKEELWKIPINHMTTTHKDLQISWFNESEKILQIDDLDWIIFNVNQFGYYRVNYDLVLWNNIISALKKSDFSEIPTSSRAALIDDSFELALKDEISYQIALDVLSYIHDDVELPPWKVADKKLKFLDAMLFNDAEIYPKFRTFLREIIDPFVNRLDLFENFDGSAESKIAIFWACQAKREECEDFVQNHFNSFLASPTSLEADLIEVVICNALKTNQDENIFNQTLQIMLEFNGDKSNLIAGLACVEEGVWLGKFLVLAFNQNTNLSPAERRQIFKASLKNHKYGYMAGLQLLHEKLSILSDGEIYFILDEIVKRFWDNRDEVVTKFARILNTLKDNGFNETHADNYLNLARTRIEWLSENRREMEIYFGLTTTDSSTTSTTEVTSDAITTTTDETSTPDQASQIKVQIILVFLVIINFLNLT